MTISAPLHRAYLQPNTTLATYKAELVAESVRFTKNPEASSAALENDVVELGSLQSEGYVKRNIADLDQKGMSFEQLMKADSDFAQDKSFIFGLTADKTPDTEALTVLSDVTREMTKLSGANPQNMIFAPQSLTGTDQMTAWIAVQDGKTVSSVYEVGFHQTPGIDGGLMLARPLEAQEISQESAQKLLNRPSLRLSQPEDGWQFAIQH